MKIAREAKLGWGIAIVLGLVIGIPFYIFAGVSSISGMSRSSVLSKPSKQPSSAEVVQAFKNNNLEVGKTYSIDEDPDWPKFQGPKTYKEGTVFEIPSISSGSRPNTGQVFTFSSRDDLNTMKSYWEFMNKQGGFFFTYVYDKDLTLVHLTGKLPKKKAQEDNDVLQKTV